MIALTQAPPNQQPPEKREHREDGYLDVVDVWHTIQGEGPFSGLPAVFVRLAGCDLQCPRCDSDYTSNRRLRSVDGLLNYVEGIGRPGPKLAVLTGGEPFRQNVGPFVHEALRRGHRLQVETNGTLMPAGVPLSFVTVVCSPKTPKIAPDLVPFVDAYKYVLDADAVHSDGLPRSALGMPGLPFRPPSGFRSSDVYLQPQDDGDPAENERNMRAAVVSCLTYGWRLCLQTHKIAGLP